MEFNLHYSASLPQRPNTLESSPFTCSILHTANNTITSITDVHHLINASWVDLLAGIHYNIHQQHRPLENMTLQSVCGPNSTLKEPEGGDGSFLEAVEKLCDLAASSHNVYEDYLYLTVGVFSSLCLISKHYLVVIIF